MRRLRDYGLSNTARFSDITGIKGEHVRFSDTKGMEAYQECEDQIPISYSEDTHIGLYEY